MSETFSRIKALVVELLEPHQRKRALVLGCGPGRLAFELATFFEEVNLIISRCLCKFKFLVLGA